MATFNHLGHRTSDLTRKEMVEIIQRGGSVFLGHEIITDVKDLPSAGELAKTDAGREAVANDIEGEIQRLQAELDGLRGKPRPATIVEATDLTPPVDAVTPATTGETAPTATGDSTPATGEDTEKKAKKG